MNDDVRTALPVGPLTMGAQPAGETTRDFLTRRKRELTQQIAALRGQILPKQKELSEVNKAMQALGLGAPGNPSTGTLALPHSYTTTLASGNFDAVASQLTIKQMILSALRDHFQSGATPAQLREYILSVYSRDIDRNSISPQITRLREEGVIRQVNDGKWEITAAGKHPDSWSEE